MNAKISSITLWENLKRQFYAQYPQYDSSETWFVNVYNGIGDAFFILGYLEAFKEKHKPKNLGVVYRSSLEGLVSLYESSFDFKLIVTQDFPADDSFADTFRPNTLLCSSKRFIHNNDWGEMVWNNNIPINEWYKYGLKLPMKARFKKPVLKNRDISDIVREKEIVQGKSVILFPFPNFGPHWDITIWETIVKKLDQLGYKVFTNCANKSFDKVMHVNKNKVSETHEPIAGTLPLNLTLEECWSVANYCGNVICAPGGISHVFINLGIKVLVVQEFKEFDAGEINSTYAGIKWNALNTIGSIKICWPTSDNLLELMYDSSFFTKFENFFKN